MIQMDKSVDYIYALPLGNIKINLPLKNPCCGMLYGMNVCKQITWCLERVAWQLGQGMGVWGQLLSTCS